MAPPGCPDLAFSTIAADRARILLAALRSNTWVSSEVMADVELILYIGFVILIKSKVKRIYPNVIYKIWNIY